ncbi:Ig-like domain-containing protein [Pseudomonas sp. LB3P58]
MTGDQTEALNNTVLVLYAPRLPEATVPVEGADAGVPLRIYDLTPMGATVEVDPYLGQQPGDTVTLNLNGQPGIDSQQTASDSSTTTLYIPKKLLLPDITNRLTYSVTRNSQNIGTSQPPLELLYNAIRPGNQDTNPGEDGHSRLDLLLPDAIKHGVGPDFPVAGAQVCVSYPYCRAYDRIRLNCNGHDVFHTVTSLQAPKPGSDEPVTVCFTLTRADLENAKDHPQFKFSYTVTDQLGNGPDTDSPWSATQIADVDLSGSRLPAPILREIQNDPTDEPGIIDLEKLGKNPLLLIVLTSDHRFLPGDTLNATYTAKVTGLPDVVVTVSGIVEADDFGQKKPCVLQVANDQVIASSVVTATYQLLRNGPVLGSSRVASARVIGEGLPDLKPPRLQKSVNGLLDPLDAANLQGANGQVEVLGYRKGDTVQLIVEGAPGAGSPTFTPLPLNANSRANFPLTKAFIAANMGKEKVRLSFLLNRDGKPLPSSPILTASVGTIPDSHPSLPTPAIDRAPGSELDVTQLQATDQLRVGEWPHQVPGQNVWVLYEGVAANGDAISYEDRKGEPHNTLPGLVRPAPIEWLKTLKDRSVLNISFRVNFDGIVNITTAVTFPLRTYTVKVTPELIVDTTPLNLNGQNISIQGTGLPWISKGVDPVGTAADRSASSGTLPYKYESSDESIASVDNNGVVRSEGNGSATITVSDAAGQEKSFTVDTTNVIRMLHNPIPSNFAQAKQWIISQGGVFMIQNEPPRREIINYKYLYRGQLQWHTGSDYSAGRFYWRLSYSPQLGLALGGYYTFDEKHPIVAYDS